MIFGLCRRDEGSLQDMYVRFAWQAPSVGWGCWLPESNLRFVVVDEQWESEGSWCPPEFFTIAGFLSYLLGYGQGLTFPLRNVI